MVRVAQVAEEVLAEPADLGPERGELSVRIAQVVDVDVPVVDPVGPPDAEELEPVEVGQDLLPEIVVGSRKTICWIGGSRSSALARMRGQ